MSELELEVSVPFSKNRRWGFGNMIVNGVSRIFTNLVSKIIHLNVTALPGSNTRINALLHFPCVRGGVHSLSSTNLDYHQARRKNLGILLDRAW